MFRHFGFNELLMLASGLEWTAGLTVLAFAGSFALGLLLLMLRVARASPLRWIAIAWINAVQGTPLLGLLFIVFFGLPLFGWDYRAYSPPQSRCRSTAVRSWQISGAAR